MKFANELAVGRSSGSTLVSIIPITMGSSRAPLQRVIQKRRIAVSSWYSITMKKATIAMERPTRRAKVRVFLEW